MLWESEIKGRRRKITRRLPDKKLSTKGSFLERVRVITDERRIKNKR